MERSTPLLLLLLAGAFLFKNLDDFLLWQDEANAALLGKSILEHGIPRVFDGRNLLLFIHSDVDDSLIYRLWGWFPLYVNALSYQLFGISTWGARLPYVLMGLGFLAWTYFHVRRHKPAWVAALFLLLMTFSVPLLLHFRQCQYYAPGIVLAGLLFFLGEGDLTRSRHRAAFVLASFLLFHSQLLIWVAAMAASGARHLVSALQRTARVKDLAWLYVPALLLCLPGLALYRPWEYGADHQTRMGIESLAYLEKMAVDLAYLIEPVFGLQAFAIAAPMIFLARLVLGRRFPPRTGAPLVFVLVYFLCLTVLSRNAYFRYFAPLIPVMLYLVAVLAEYLVASKRIVGVMFLSGLLLTNVLQIRFDQAGHADSVLGKYVSELTHQNSDVNEELVHYLAQNSRPTDVVFTNYGAFPIIYYTQLVVGGGPTGYLMPSIPQRVPVATVEKPEWIVVRRSFEVHMDVLSELLDRDEYEKQDLDGVDTIWGNRPSPYFHHYATPTEAPPIELYRRRAGA